MGGRCDDQEQQSEGQRSQGKGKKVGAREGRGVRSLLGPVAGCGGPGCGAVESLGVGILSSLLGDRVARPKEPGL